MTLLVIVVLYLGIGIISGMILDGMAVNPQEHPFCILCWMVFWLPICLAIFIRWIREGGIQLK